MSFPFLDILLFPLLSVGSLFFNVIEPPRVTPFYWVDRYREGRGEFRTLRLEFNCFNGCVLSFTFITSRVLQTAVKSTLSVIS